MVTVDKKDMETIRIARKYGLAPGTIRCEVFTLFEQCFMPREVKFILRDLKIDSEGRTFPDDINRYYYTWKHSQKNLVVKRE